MKDIIREYLLGGLTLEEQEQVEERLILEKEYLQQARLIADELIDDYVYDRLSMEEKEGIISHFLSAPEQQQKLKFALALKTYISESKTEDLSNAVNYSLKPSFWFRYLLTRIRSQGPAGDVSKIAI